MDLQKYFKEILNKTDILKSPKRRLSTFGTTRINYFFLSEIEGFVDRSRLRKGLITAEKPKIITSELLNKKFQGFGDQTDPFKEWLSHHYGDLFQGLEYQFKNESTYVQIEHSGILALSDEIQKRMNEFETNNSVIMRGPDNSWQISLMKFIVDECLASFNSNMRDLEQHGFFETSDDVLKDRKKIIENLFAKAKMDRSILPILQQKLKSFGLFKEYEDDFFKLVK